MRIPEDVRKCVAYLGIDVEKNGVSKRSYRGTGFFVGVRSEILGGSFLFFVTAKHVAVNLSGKHFYIRANKRDGTSENIVCPPDLGWVYHPCDQAADVALLPIGLSQEIFDYLAIQESIFLTDTVRAATGIGPGDEVFIAGLFSHHAGNSKNLPIIRTGNVAMIPEEKIPTSSFGDMDAYLIEARSLGGLSGSPVFVLHQPSLGQFNFYLMGLIHGHWDTGPESMTDETADDMGIKARLNVGIAIVTPASKIAEILNSEALLQQRRAVEAEHIAKKPPTATSQ